MDVLLSKVTQQAMNYAIRSGITITAGYALRQSSRLLKNVDDSAREELQALQERLDSKIRIISPAIDMIELISARGNTSLESAVSLTKSLRWEIQELGQRLARAANEGELMQRNPESQPKHQNELELKRIVIQIRKVLSKIEDAVPLINLAITTSGASLSTSLPTTISPSRLLQASTFLTAGDTAYSSSASPFVQIGPTFTLSLYMLFLGHSFVEKEEDMRQSTWKEVIHKARLKLVRVPLDSLYDLPQSEAGLKYGRRSDSGVTELPGSNDDQRPNIEAEGKEFEYAYQLLIVEDLEDDRVHTYEEYEAAPGPYDDVHVAGIREAIPVHEISKIFYADTGKILNIGNEGEVNSPVLLLKRDTNAIPPRRMMERFQEANSPQAGVEHPSNADMSRKNVDQDTNQIEIDAQFEREQDCSSTVSIGSFGLSPRLNQWHIPADLDPEWLAFEVYTDDPQSDTESEIETPGRNKSSSRSPSIDPEMTRALSKLYLNDTPRPDSFHSRHLISQSPPTNTVSMITAAPLPPIRTSLSLLETILRLLSLQQFQQTSHLSIPDELLNFFLSESATTGAAQGDEHERRRLRAEARRQVGFDPYDESPIKRRGEEYQYRGGESQAGWNHTRENGYEDYVESAEERNYDGYGSSRYDEGYDSHRIYSPTHPSASDGQPVPATPPLLLKNRAYSSRGNTPDRSAPPLPRSSSDNMQVRHTSPGLSPGIPRFRTDKRTSRMRFEDVSKVPMKKGSPLARPGTGITDEGLGTSPISTTEEPKD